MASAYSQPRGKSLRRQEAGDRPIAAGLNLDPRHVSTIDDSHQRCLALGLSRIERPDLGLIGRSDLAVARDRNLRLHAHAAPVMELLYDQIVNTHSMVVLTDASGTILHAIGDDDFLDRASKVALQPGAVWSEPQKGTNAVGTALMEEKPTLVHADEHYLHANHFLTCSAAPILDPRGNILGVLDVSGDHRSYHQHTMALVKMSARMIENHWLSDDYRSVMRLHFHGRVEFIGTLMEGILAVKPDGRIVGANRGALEHLGMSGATLRMQTLESLFGTSVGALVDRFRSPLATPMAVQFSGGRALFLHARFDWPVWTSLAEAVAAQVPAAATVAAPLRSATVDALMHPAPIADAVVSPAAVPTGSVPRGPQVPLDAQVALMADRVQRALERRIPVIIQGETGTGKEWLARTAHEAARGAQPLRFVSCANAGQDELDNAFASTQTDETTLLLDEVSDLPMALQAHLLWLLDQPLHRAATAADPPEQAAIICTSRLSLRAQVEAGRFREDLFYRLNGLSVRLPALHERTDIEALSQLLLRRECTDIPMQLDVGVLEVLRCHRWPGNVRQLCNVLRAAVVLAGHDAVIARHHLPDDYIQEAGAAAAPAAPAAPALPAPQQSLELLEREVIRLAVANANGNISEASKRLGISRNTIYRKLRWNERH
jgi:sigma-54 dependent transcriptional regulator, acetoin dehydrogenase operon transcriptional activator AcoR